MMGRMSALEIQRGERGRWPKKKAVASKAVSSKPGVSNPVRRKALKVAALGTLRAAGFVAWSEPKDDEDGAEG